MITTQTATTPRCSVPARDARGRFAARARSADEAPSGPARTIGARASRGRGVAGMQGTPIARCMRALPPRDSRGRFVAFPTTAAPSWFVLCVGGDRVAAAPSTPIEAGAQAPKVARSSAPRVWRPDFSRSGLHSAFLVMLVIVMSAWYRLQLPVPTR
jgi:hypothetical protein